MPGLLDDNIYTEILPDTGATHNVLNENTWRALVAADPQMEGLKLQVTFVSKDLEDINAKDLDKYR